MAKIVFGLGTSHGPLLSTPPDMWHLRAEDDRKNPHHPFRGEIYNFDELVALRVDENLLDQIQPEVKTARYEACQKAIEILGERLAAAAPDVVVIMGNDQHEMFQPTFNPAFSVFYGDSVENLPVSADRLEKMSPGIRVSRWATSPPETAIYPCVPDLGLHIIDQLIDTNFDVTVMNEIPEGPRGHKGIPHAYGFVYRRIMHDRAIPAVPIVLNTFYPPNQPTALRCFEFGQTVARAIESWDSDLRVAVISSGGLSHFVVDEEFDHKVLDAMKAKDAKAFAAIPANHYLSGTSETKNWIAGVGALSLTDLEMDLIDYVPCYRSEAGTGNAMAFATWQ